MDEKRGRPFQATYAGGLLMTCNHNLRLQKYSDDVVIVENGVYISDANGKELITTGNVRDFEFTHLRKDVKNFDMVRGKTPKWFEPLKSNIRSNSIGVCSVVPGDIVHIFGWDFQPILNGQAPRRVHGEGKIGNLVKNPFDVSLDNNVEVWEVHNSSVPGLSGAPYFTSTNVLIGINLGGGSTNNSVNYMLPITAELRSLFLDTSLKNSVTLPRV